MGLGNRNPPLQEFSHSLREYNKHWIMGCRQLTCFFDLTKACDILNHRVLLEKSYPYGVTGNINSCLNLT
jgi:hypothetical protein